MCRIRVMDGIQGIFCYISKSFGCTACNYSIFSFFFNSSSTPFPFEKVLGAERAQITFGAVAKRIQLPFG
jgi:hypothetical protein